MLKKNNNIVLVWLFFLLILSSMAGCSGSRNMIGTLHVMGDNAFLNGEAATSGMKIYCGDHLYTEEDTSVVVNFDRGGFVQLDENTDPVFDYIKNGMYIMMRILTGRAYAESDKLCLNAPQLSSCSHSKIQIDIGVEKTVLTLLEGRAEIEVPEIYRMGAGQQVIVSDSQIAAVNRLSTCELDTLLEWRYHFNSTLETLSSLRVYFPVDSVEINESAKEILGKVVRMLNVNPWVNIRIEGHTDNTGPGEVYNCDLSLKRASVVMDYLIGQGIDDQRLEISGRCSRFPVECNESEMGRKKNRRVEFIPILWN
ncbi:MAG: OmpA family protein [Desulfobacteraceae bacterium]|nr:OmpA family protein [Desulfobacteraceae bacterium]